MYSPSSRITQPLDSSQRFARPIRRNTSPMLCPSNWGSLYVAVGGGTVGSTFCPYAITAYGNPLSAFPDFESVYRQLAATLAACFGFVHSLSNFFIVGKFGYFAVGFPSAYASAEGAEQADARAAKQRTVVTFYECFVGILVSVGLRPEWLA